MAEVNTQQGAAKPSRYSRTRNVETVRSLIKRDLELYKPPASINVYDASTVKTSPNNPSDALLDKTKRVYSNDSGDSNFATFTLDGVDYYYDTDIDYSDWLTTKVGFLLMNGRWFILDEGDGGDYTITDNGSGKIRLTVLEPTRDPFPATSATVPKLYFEFTLIG